MPDTAIRFDHVAIRFFRDPDGTLFKGGSGTSPSAVPGRAACG